MPSNETILKLTKNNKFDFMLPGKYKDLYYIDEIINVYVKRRYGRNFIFYYNYNDCWFSTDGYYKCWIDWNETKTKL